MTWTVICGEENKTATNLFTIRDTIKKHHEAGKTCLVVAGVPQTGEQFAYAVYFRVACSCSTRCPSVPDASIFNILSAAADFIRFWWLRCV